MVPVTVTRDTIGGIKWCRYPVCCTFYSIIIHHTRVHIPVVYVCAHYNHLIIQFIFSCFSFKNVYNTTNHKFHLLFLPPLTAHLCPTSPSHLVLSFTFFKKLQPRQHHFFGCFLYFTGQEEFIHDHVHLVKVKDEVQFTHIAKKQVQHLNKQMNGF